jgi:hypothetical protein
MRTSAALGVDISSTTAAGRHGDGDVPVASTRGLACPLHENLLPRPWSAHNPLEAGADPTW